MKFFACGIALLFWLSACTKPQRADDNGAFKTTPESTASCYDLGRIEESGELIIATLSGPDTYFDYNGVPMGAEYALAENFAASLGLRLRVELAHDTTELSRMLSAGHADIIALQLPQPDIARMKLLAAGARNDSLRTSWAVHPDAAALAAALDEWYGDGVRLTPQERQRRSMSARTPVRRKVHASYISREKGVISIYDEHFRQAARTTGWDWRLIAAQCYQESCFDPNAVSWAGARGLMQIMPATAEHLGLPADRIYTPADNIAAAARYLRELSGHFADVRDPAERRKFVLAAYNGGHGHIRDAMALARKHGRNPQSWQDVSYFVRCLSQPEYYRDPVVHHGYMIGRETAGYVQAIMDRWRAYGGRPDAPGATVDHPAAGRPAKRNRFTKDTKIYRPDDPEFNQLGE